MNSKYAYWLLVLLACLCIGCSTLMITNEEPRMKKGFPVPEGWGIEFEQRRWSYRAVDGRRLYKKPRLIHYEEPVYPRLPRLAWIQGVVEVDVIINKKGIVETAEIVKTSVSPVMNRSVLIAVKKFKYTPGQRKNVPVKCRARHRIRFWVK